MKSFGSRWSWLWEVVSPSSWPSYGKSSWSISHDFGSVGEICKASLVISTGLDSGYPVRASVFLWACVYLCLCAFMCTCVFVFVSVGVCLYSRGHVSTLFARPRLVWSPLLASSSLACLDLVCFAQPVCLPGQLLPNPRVSIRFEPARCSPHTLPWPPMMMMDRFWWRRRPSPMNVNSFCCN